MGREESLCRGGEGAGKGQGADVAVCSESEMRSGALKALPGRILGAQGRLWQPGAAGLPEAASDRQSLEPSALFLRLLRALGALHALNSKPRAGGKCFSS